ncbi:Sec1-like protein [Kipferlia bialata]|uniref:Sec1-like protein n=1 Tax=Kipferlia bialata TaxID=797122 RepID=A0A9K3CZM7_9EUKA|nr:Sec1-like protein [Kipferlia bialata]|eukprot:g8225.t1
MVIFLQVVILARESDPVSPLCLPWYFGPMVHDLQQVTSGRVSVPEGRGPTLIDIPFCRALDVSGLLESLWDCNFGEAMDRISAAASTVEANAREGQSAASGDVRALSDYVSRLNSIMAFKDAVAGLVKIAGAVNKTIDDHHAMGVGEAQQAVGNSVCEAAEKRLGGGRGGRVGARAAVDVLQRAFSIDPENPPPSMELAVNLVLILLLSMELAVNLVLILLLRFREDEKTCTRAVEAFNECYQACIMAVEAFNECYQDADAAQATISRAKRVLGGKSTLDWSVVEQAIATQLSTQTLTEWARNKGRAQIDRFEVAPTSTASPEGGDVGMAPADRRDLTLSNPKAIPKQAISPVQTAPFFFTVPKVVHAAEAAVGGVLPASQFPFTPGTSAQCQGLVLSKNQRTGLPAPHDVLIFVLGGVTMGEASAMRLGEFYAKAGHKDGAALSVLTARHVYIGGNVIHTSKTFLESLK